MGTSPATPRITRRIESARARARQAAWELAQERPWEEITVALICQQADIAPRTFSRYFPDKVEVLFADADDHARHLRESMSRHPLDAADLHSYVDAVLSDMADHIVPYGAMALAARQRIIQSSPELRARELLKREQLLDIATDCLRERWNPADPYAARMIAARAVHAAFAAMNQWALTGGDLHTHARQALTAGHLTTRTPTE